VDTTLFHKSYDLVLLVQVYVDNIIVGATKEWLYEYFSKLMQAEFQMSMMGELKFFLGMQTKQKK